MDYREKLARLRLIRSKKIGPVTFMALLRRFGNAVDAIDAIPELNQKSGIPTKIISSSAAEKELSEVEKIGGKLFVKGEDHYPEIFMNYDDTPGCLTILGHQHLLQKDSIGIVGSRNASANAKKLIEIISQQLSGRNYVITSGMARGIDAAVHRGAIQNGTIAIVAGGVDQIYPKENAKLYHDIVEMGVVMSEMPLGMLPTARLFPIRNRLISALSQGVVVAEANIGSGSLITARDAAERGVEVMAIPGSPLDPRAQGCNSLIREGAHLVQNSDDIINIVHRFNFSSKDASVLYNPVQKQPLQSNKDMLEARKIITKHLSFTPTEVDELIRQCHLSASMVQSVLLKMEFDGEIIRVFGNRVYRSLPDDFIKAP